MAQQRKETRRTGQVRTRGRAAGVVARVFSATIEELGRVGYAAMRVEDVALQSGVNKTTIYRRWPTKAKLVAAVLIEQGRQRLPPIDTGTLRGDLRASLLGAFNLKPSEQGILRTMVMERSIPEVDALAKRFRDELRAMRIAMVRRGIARGELPQGVDVELVVDLVSAPVQRALLFNETIKRRDIERVLDVVLAGAAAEANTKPKRTRARAATRSKRKKARAG